MSKRRSSPVAIATRVRPRVPGELRAALGFRRPETRVGLRVPGSSRPAPPRSAPPGPATRRRGAQWGIPLGPDSRQGEPSEKGPGPSWGGGLDRRRLRLPQLSPENQDASSPSAPVSLHRRWTLTRGRRPHVGLRVPRGRHPGL